MTSLTLDIIVDEKLAWNQVIRRAPTLRMVQAELRYHPFAGIAFEMPTLLGRSHTVHTLVDYYTGKAFLCGPWQGSSEPVPHRQRVKDPQWFTVDLEQARQRASRTVATANMRRTRLAGRGGLREQRVIPTVWKPNWLFHATLDERRMQIMVDGLNGGYFVVGS